MTAHGIMLHHFHRPGGQPPGQGSVTAETLDAMIGFLGRGNIISATEWYERAVSGTLEGNSLCLTFDDNLMCQYEIALPVLERHGLTAFFFIYSSVFEGNIEDLEVYRLFRNTHFSAAGEFYAAFEQAVQAHLPEAQLEQRLRDFRPEEYLKSCGFYTPQDRRFRYIRDQVLGDAPYRRVMDAMIAGRDLSKWQLAENLWMNDACLRHLADKGHVIGLHSYSHPLQLNELPQKAQAEEYRKNFTHIARITGQPPSTMSHPCNAYTPETLALLRGMGVRLGFCATMGEVPNRSELEFPRRDHADVLREMAA